MKKSIILLCSTMLLLTSCTVKTQGDLSNNKEAISTQTERGVWLSYSEIDELLTGEKGIKDEFPVVLKNCIDLKITSLYLQVRPFCDSLYPSSIFPLHEKVKRYDYDVFGYMVNACHKAGIKVHAWINPYRVRMNSTDIQELPQESPAYIWRHDSDRSNDDNVLIWQGIYLNPAKEEVRKLVIDGIREILLQYPVDGIHFDDYFYPTADKQFDKNTYEEYTAQADVPQGLSDWRRSHVNTLIEGCCTAIHHLSAGCVFSVSPAASIEKNFQDMFADVRKWIENQWIDRIIPQLYFGFTYPDENFCFKTLLKEWKALFKGLKGVDLQIGLGCYKIETTSEADLPEWSKGEDIIAREAKLCMQERNVSGFVLFSYRSLFSKEERNIRQRENLLKVL